MSSLMEAGLDIVEPRLPSLIATDPSIAEPRFSTPDPTTPEPNVAEPMVAEPIDIPKEGDRGSFGEAAPMGKLVEAFGECTSTGVRTGECARYMVGRPAVACLNGLPSASICAGKLMVLAPAFGVQSGDLVDACTK